MSHYPRRASGWDWYRPDDAAVPDDPDGDLHGDLHGDYDPDAGYDEDTEDADPDDPAADLRRYADRYAFMRLPVPTLRIDCTHPGCDRHEVMRRGGIDQVRRQVWLWRAGWRRDPRSGRDYCPAHAPVDTSAPAAGLAVTRRG